MRDEVRKIVGPQWSLGGWCCLTKALEMYDRLQELSLSFACPLQCVEVGVYEGKSLFVQAVALRDSNYGGMITGIDPYTVEANVEGFDLDDHNQKAHVDWWTESANLKGALKKCQREIVAHKLGQWCELVVSTAEDFFVQNSSFTKLHWIHLDDAHSPTTSLRNAQLLVPYLLPGGILCVDDVHWPTMQPALAWIAERLEKVAEHDADGMQWAFFRN